MPENTTIVSRIAPSVWNALDWQNFQNKIFAYTEPDIGIIADKNSLQYRKTYKKQHLVHLQLNNYRFSYQITKHLQQFYYVEPCVSQLHCMIYDPITNEKNTVSYTIVEN